MVVNNSEDEKEKLVEYRKKHYRMRKKCVITKSNDLKSSFEAINLNKNFESIYKNR